uniref:Oxidoreductase-like domain-containing protein n=1 Tax=Kalanchoe fedtschenkoi TaxID=63787 RepID=A0A7N0UFV5_KALFE
MESTNPFHLSSSTIRQRHQSSHNVRSAMLLRAASNLPRRSTIPARLTSVRIPDLKPAASYSAMVDPKEEKPAPVKPSEGEEEEKAVGTNKGAIGNVNPKEEARVPPPPEKPLPDDCCGSGCVRCVWDVYYDELEEYNKLYAHKS